MTDSDSGSGPKAPRKRADAQRNEQALLDAAAKVFVVSGVDAPVRDIAAAAGVGMGTIYRHFPTRAELIIAVYQHQVDATAEVGPALLAGGDTPHAALTKWADMFVDFLTTKHGLAGALQSDSARFEILHAYFLDRLVPVCAQLLDAAVAAGEIRPGTDALSLLRGVGNLCVGADGDPSYDARRLVHLLIAGLLQPAKPRQEPGDLGPRVPRRSNDRSTTPKSEQELDDPRPGVDRASTQQAPAHHQRGSGHRGQAGVGQ